MSLTKLFQWTWALIVVLSGAGVGAALFGGLGQEAAQQAPNGWERLDEQVPFRRADLMGDLPSSGESYSLDHFMAMAAEAPSDAWDLEIELGAGSELRVLLEGRVSRPESRHSTAGNQVLGDGLLIRRSRGGGVTGMHFEGKTHRSLPCQGALPLPGPGPYALRLQKTKTGFVAYSGGAQMSCDSPSTGGTPTLMAGLHRVRIPRSQTDSGVFTGPALISPRWGGFLGALLGIFLWWVERRRGADHRITALTSLPLLVAWPLQGADGLGLVEQLRMPGLSPHLFALWIPLFLTVPLKAAHHLARASRRAEHWKKGLLISTTGGGVLFLLLSLAAQPRWLLACLYFAAAGALFGALVGINALARRLRYVNALSLLLLCGILGATEWGLRFTATGVTWTPSGRMQFDEQLGWTRSTISDFEALERGEHSSYPLEGYPVAIPAETQAIRVVCLGSSATGGAFQNDDLSEFYPARLQEILGDKAQVLNQGVGGWTTFHMARYAEKKKEELRPDILTLYIGHNDVLTKTSAPYKTLFGNWQQGKSMRTPLPNVRLFQGLRFLLSALAQPSVAIAVPVDHARENIERIHELAERTGAKLLLMPEAISPDSAALTDYDAMLRKLAEANEDMAYLDVPSLLLNTPGDFFLDDVHLSDRGHRRLAGAMAETLRAQGWVSAPADH
jgi:lysophospholipase L1-like esterase